MNNLMAQSKTLTRFKGRLAIIALFAALLALAPFYTAQAAPPSPSAPSLGSASGYAVLAGTAVTCTNSTVTGDVGVWPGTAVTQTGCVIDGAVDAGNGAAKQAYLDFVSVYDNLALLNNTCDLAHTLTGNLAGVTLTPGTYCVDAVAKMDTLTLDDLGDANATWLFLVDGALTGTNFNVVMLNGGVSCNVTWWVEAAATMTTSNFLGTILAGEAITVTGGTFNGNALAKAAVTMTDTEIVGCEATTGHKGKDRSKCNQGVGNGPEGCDPGNSNQGDPSRSNDELAGTPGNPGRKGGNGK